MKVTIAGLPDGPYKLTPDPAEPNADILRGTDGKGLPVGKPVSLCRCGGSKNKPFCDGSHRTNGFKSANTADPRKNKRAVYAGKQLTIYDTRAICAHAGACTDGLPDVFREEGSPWIEPDAADVAGVVATIDKCPSGALSYALHAGKATAPNDAPRVHVTRDGPYAIEGAVELVDASFGEGASTNRYTLCRCGASKNKPFCDGSHWGVEFKDPA